MEGARTVRQPPLSIPDTVTEVPHPCSSTFIWPIPGYDFKEFASFLLRADPDWLRSMEIARNDDASVEPEV